MRTAFYLVILFVIGGCSVHALKQKNLEIIEIKVTEYPSSRSWSVTETKKIEALESVLRSISPVRKELLHGLVTRVPLDFRFVIKDTEGNELYYEFSKAHLRSLEATWPISEEQYETLRNSLGI